MSQIPGSVLSEITYFYPLQQQSLLSQEDQLNLPNYHVFRRFLVNGIRISRFDSINFEPVITRDASDL